MEAELVLRCLANGSVLLAIVWVLRRRAERVGGLLAALPVLSAPALFRLSVDHSPTIAAVAAVGSLHTTGLTATLVLLYALARRHVGALPAFLISSATALLVAVLTRGIALSLWPSLVFTLGLVALARHCLPHLGPCELSSCPFLRGYIDGLLVRCAFLAVLSLALVPLGGWLAFPLAALTAIAVLVTVVRGGGGRWLTWPATVAPEAETAS